MQYASDRPMWCVVCVCVWVCYGNWTLKTDGDVKLPVCVYHPNTSLLKQQYTPDFTPVLCVPDQSAVQEISGNFLILIQPQDHKGLKHLSRQRQNYLQHQIFCMHAVPW